MASFTVAQNVQSRAPSAQQGEYYAEGGPVSSARLCGVGGLSWSTQATVKCLK